MSSNNNSNSNTPDSETSTNIPYTDEARRISQRNEMNTDENKTLLQIGIQPDSSDEFYVQGNNMKNVLYAEASDNNSDSDTFIDAEASDNNSDSDTVIDGDNKNDGNNNKLPVGNIGTEFMGDSVNALSLIKPSNKIRKSKPLTRTLTTNPLASVDEQIYVMNGRVNKILESIISKFLYNDDIKSQIETPFTEQMNIDTVKYLMPKETVIDPSFNKLLNNKYDLSNNLFDIVKEEGGLTGGNSTQVSTTSSAFSQSPSSVVNDFAKRFELSKLYNSTGNNAVNPFSTIFNEVCKYRHKPQVIKTDKSRNKTTVDLSALRNIACNKIGEETQMSDIWGGKIVSYAMGLYTDGKNTHKGLTDFLHGDGKDFYKLGKNNKIQIPELGFPKCYICQQDIIPAWGEVTFGSRGRRRICPEMEHKYPCISAFTRSPTYVILNKYKCKLINNSRDDTYLKAWKYFINNDSNFKHLLELYKNINCTETFSKGVINDNFNKIKSNFEALFVKEDLVFDQKVFEWAFSVIKYWCHEFAYSHHTCNMAKSNLDFSKLGNEHDNPNTQKTKIKTFISNCVTRFSAKGDTLSAFEKKWILVSNNKQHNASGKTFTSFFPKKKLEDRLLNVFNEMDNITNEIVEKYRDVTSVLGEKQIQTNSNEEGGKLTENEEKTIKNVLIGKGLMIMYKRYKESAKVKKGNIKETSSSSKTRKRKNDTTKTSHSSTTKKNKLDGNQQNMYEMFGVRQPKEQQKTIPKLFSKQQKKQEKQQEKNEKQYNTRGRKQGGKKSKRRTLKKKYKK